MRYALLIVLLLPALAMGQTAEKNFGSGARGTNWTNPNNVHADDDADAEYGSAGMDWLVDTTFSFSTFHADSAIDSYLVILEGVSDGNSTEQRSYHIQMYDGIGTGDIITGDFTTKNVREVDTLRGTTNGIWGSTINTWGEITGADFGVQTQKSTTSTKGHDIDWIQIEVWVSEGGAAVEEYEGTVLIIGMIPK